jgi:hypothetical protein
MSASKVVKTMITLPFRRTFAPLLFSAVLAIGGGAQAETCKIAVIEVDHEPGGGFDGATANVYIEANPADTQRAISGSAMIYYRYEEPDGSVHKDSTISMFNDVISDDEDGTTLELPIVFLHASGTITRVSDVRFLQLNCTY